LVDEYIVKYIVDFFVLSLNIVKVIYTLYI